MALSLLRGGAARGSSAGANKALATVPLPSGMVGRIWSRKFVFDANGPASTPRGAQCNYENNRRSVSMILLQKERIPSRMHGRFALISLPSLFTPNGGLNPSGRHNQPEVTKT